MPTKKSQNPDAAPNPTGVGLDHTPGKTNADRAREAAERKEAAVRERQALWPTLSQGQQMLRVYGTQKADDLIQEERNLRAWYNRDTAGFIREMRRYEAEERDSRGPGEGRPAGLPSPPAKEEPAEEPLTDAGCERTKALIEQLIRECDTGG